MTDEFHPSKKIFNRPGFLPYLVPTYSLYLQAERKRRYRYIIEELRHCFYNMNNNSKTSRYVSHWVIFVMAYFLGRHHWLRHVT